MKTSILIALIASLQIAGPALALEQSDWITPDSSIDTQVDITGTQAAPASTAPAAASMQSGWVTQSDNIQPAQAAQATQNAAPAQSAPPAQSTGTGQSQWVTSNGSTSCDQTQLQGKVTKSHGSGSGAASAVGSALGHAAGGIAAAAVAVPMMMAASRMMYGGYGGYGGYGFGGFRGYGPGAYRYGPSMGMGGMMGGYMLQNAAFNMLRGL